MTVGPGMADNGFHEACAIVADLDEGLDRWCRVLGYSLIWRGAADPGALSLMTIAPEVTGLEALIGDPVQKRGFIRMFAFPGLDNGVMRDGAQSWDVGGIFDINVRSLCAIEPFHREMTRSGFTAFGPITAWDFGPLGVKEVVERDADGLAIALIERFKPPLSGFEHVVGHASYVFNSTQVVPSFDAARAFYVDALGWTPFQETRVVQEGGNNCMGLPLDVARTRELQIGIYHPQGLNEGSVEILEYAGEALDFSSASPPDRGWASLRFPMVDIDGFLSRAHSGGCVIIEPRAVVMAPSGTMRAGSAITPWGARLEVYEVA